MRTTSHMDKLLSIPTRLPELIPVFLYQPIADLLVFDQLVGVDIPFVAGEVMAQDGRRLAGFGSDPEC